MKAGHWEAVQEQIRVAHEATDRLLASLPADMLARTRRPHPADAPERTRLMVPKMPHEFGLSCEWHCLPDSIERDCLIHGGYTPVR